MTSPHLPPGSRPIAAASFRQTRQRLAYVRQQEQALPQLRGFRREVAARTWEQQWCETRCQLPARYSPRSRTVPRAPAPHRPPTPPHGTAPYHPQPRRYV
jgi:hypothetical protein